jgi:hypothetical protein
MPGQFGLGWRRVVPFFGIDPPESIFVSSLCLATMTPFYLRPWRSLEKFREGFAVSWQGGSNQLIRYQGNLGIPSGEGLASQFTCLMPMALSGMGSSQHVVQNNRGPVGLFHHGTTA